MARIFLWFVAMFMAGASCAQELAGRVVSVTDGDTITLLNSVRQQHKIRLAGIDAPEAHQPFGQRSRANLAAMVFNREVTAVCSKVDRYQWQICKVLANGIDVNLEQVKAGMAWWYKDHAREQSPKDREDYEIAEFNAKMRRFGLWADKNPIPPWEGDRR